MKKLLLGLIVGITCLTLTVNGQILTFQDLTIDEQIEYAKRKANKWDQIVNILERRKNNTEKFSIMDKTDWTQEEEDDFIIEKRSVRTRSQKDLTKVYQIVITPQEIRNDLIPKEIVE